MKSRPLYDALPFLNHIDAERQEQFERYFQSAPLWLLDAFRVEELKRGEVFVREGEVADTIFFIGQGIIEAIDYRVYGTPYDFMQFDRVYAFGGMEFLMDLDKYMTTLRTVTDCTIVRLPRAKFEKWLYSDIQAMKQESKLVSEYLLKESRNSRLFLFLQGSDRLALLFVERYEKYNKNGLLHVKGNRQNLADETGLCLKSVSRGVKKFQEDNLISKEGNQIFINQEQYEGLKRIVSKKIDLG
ncbi:MAG: Crp/Fnr family transcriptional regulator [Lachnospiraceae bacterium]|nr:Crp/Fnr family transcriptional regulator [Lachnospiraceae bacterium]